jgi:hypothetical protein
MRRFSAWIGCAEFNSGCPFGRSQTPQRRSLRQLAPDSPKLSGKSRGPQRRGSALLRRGLAAHAMSAAEPTAFFPAARPALSHIVIGGLGRDDERICGAEGHSARCRAEQRSAPGVAPTLRSAHAGLKPGATIFPPPRGTLPRIVIGTLGPDDERICGAEGHSAKCRAEHRLTPG